MMPTPAVAAWPMMAAMALLESDCVVPCARTLCSCGIVGTPSSVRYDGPNAGAASSIASSYRWKVTSNGTGAIWRSRSVVMTSPG